MAKRLIMVGIDGCHRSTLYGLMDRGDAPFFKSLMSNGVRVTRAVTMFPSTTTSCCSSLYTGCWYRNHGVLNNEWMDRFAEPPAPRSYIAGLHYSLASMDIKLFGWPTILLPKLNKGGSANNDLQRPTVYEELTKAGKTSYTFFHYIGKGATRWVRPGRMDMIRFAYVETQVKPLQIYERHMVTKAIKHMKNRMPDVLSIFFGCNDGHSHRHGVEGQVEYLRDFVDPEMRRLKAAIDRLCPNDEIYYAITADHGQTTMPESARKKCVFDFDFFPVLQQSGFETVERGLSDKDVSAADAVISLGTGASLGFYLKNRATRQWKDLPDFGKDVAPVLNSMLKANAGAPPFPDWKFPGYVDFLLTRKNFNEPYGIYIAEPPFESEGKIIPLDEYFADKTGYIKPLERLRGIDNPKGPDIVMMLNYKDFFNVSTEEEFHPGQHGSLFEDDSYVPMIFSGPGLKTGEIEEAFTIDFSPTAASLLGVAMPSADGKPLPVFA